MTSLLGSAFRRLFIISALFMSVFVSLGGEACAGGSPVLPYQAAWTRQMGTTARDTAQAVSVDGSGNIFVAGWTGGGLDGNVSAGGYDLFLAKYGPDGVKQWTRQMGTSFGNYAYGVSVDGDGNVYVAGETDGGLGGNVSAGSFDMFVAKYDTDGVRLWTRQLGTSVGDNGYCVTVDGAGDVYVSGRTDGGLDGNANAGYGDLFVVKYDSDGVKQWTRQMGTSVNDIGYGLSVDGVGNVYVSGSTDGGLDGNVSAGFSDLFVVKYDSGGVKQWTRQLGSASGDEAHGVTVDGSGYVYAVGYTYGGLDGNSSAGSADLFVVKYSSDGVKQWTRQLGTTSGDYAYGVSVDGVGNVYVAGYTLGGLDGNVRSGAGDFFLVKYSTAGAKQWTRQMGTNALYSSDAAYGVSVDGSGNVYVAGETYGGLNGNASAGGWDYFLIRFVPDPFSEITYPADGATLSGANATISGTSSASNGVAFVEVSTNGGSTWQTASGTDPWDFLWSLPNNTVCNIKSRATDTLGNIETPGPGINVTVSNPLAIDSVTATPASPQVYGTDITWTTAASGGSGSYLYSYYRKGPDTGGLYIKTRDWDASASWDWTPAPAQVGTNYIKVKVKDSSGTEVYSWQSFNVTHPPIVIQLFGATPPSPKPSGTPIIWAATVTGGSGSYQYCFYRKGPDTGVFTLMQGWGPSASCPWTPGAAQAGSNTIKVKVRNSTGGTITQAVKGFKVQ